MNKTKSNSIIKIDKRLYFDRYSDLSGLDSVGFEIIFTDKLQSVVWIIK